MHPTTLFAKIQSADLRNANLADQRMIVACATALDKGSYLRPGAKNIQFRVTECGGLYVLGHTEGVLERYLKEKEDFPPSTKVSLRPSRIDVSSMYDDTAEWEEVLYVDIKWE